MGSVVRLISGHIGIRKTGNPVWLCYLQTCRYQWFIRKSIMLKYLCTLKFKTTYTVTADLIRICLFLSGIVRIATLPFDGYGERYGGSLADQQQINQTHASLFSLNSVRTIIFSTGLATHLVYCKLSRTVMIRPGLFLPRWLSLRPPTPCGSRPRPIRR